MPRTGLDAAAVVAAAATLADEQGVQGLTLARLAERLGVRTPSLYQHVGGLEDLRARLTAHGATLLAAAIAEAAAGRSGRDALAAVADAYRAFAHAHPGLYGAMQRPPDPADADAVQTGERVVELVAAVLRGYALEGDDAIHGVRLVRAVLHGFVSLEAAGGFALPLSLDETWRRLVEMLDRGLRTDSGVS